MAFFVPRSTCAVEEAVFCVKSDPQGLLELQSKAAGYFPNKARERGHKLEAHPFPIMGKYSRGQEVGGEGDPNVANTM